MAEALDTHDATTDNAASPMACCGRREALRAAGVVAIAGAGLTACGASADDVADVADVGVLGAPPVQRAR